LRWVARSSIPDQRRALLLALWLNIGLAAALFISGVIAQSSGLIANGLDNTSDAVVHALSCYATTRGTQWKVRAARLSGIMLILLSAGVLVDVWRRFVSGAEPVSGVMIGMTIAAAGST